MEKRYKCVKSYTNKEIGEIYNENEKPNWFKNFNSIKEYREKGFRFWEYFKLVEEDLIKKDTFVLPERWKVLITDESKETLEKHRLTLPKQTSDVHSVLCDDAHGKFYLSTDKEYSDYQFWGKSRIENYTEITFEQFKTHILKEKTMEKEIIGYKLIKPKYLEAVSKIIGFGYAYQKDETIHHSTEEITVKLKEAGVFDLWFEPVFKEEFKKDDYVTVVSTGTYNYDLSCSDTKPIIGKTYKIYNVNTNYIDLNVSNGRIAIKSSDLRKATKEEIKKASISLPIINSYLGKMDGDFIIYGSNCARFHKDFFIKLNEINFLGTHDGNRTIKSIELSSGVKITIEEIKQIVEYIRNK